MRRHLESLEGLEFLEMWNCGNVEIWNCVNADSIAAVAGRPPYHRSVWTVTRAVRPVGTRVPRARLRGSPSAKCRVRDTPPRMLRGFPPLSPLRASRPSGRGM